MRNVERLVDIWRGRQAVGRRGRWQKFGRRRWLADAAGAGIGRAVIGQIQMDVVVVEDVRARPGWLIYYGHDVCDKPSAFGCTAAYMEEVLKIVSGTCEIMTVGAALNHIRGRT